MAETHGLLIYERLLSFAEYRKESGNETQQHIYNAVVTYLVDNRPDTEDFAVEVAIGLAAELSSWIRDGEISEEYFERFIAELKEIYAIIALTKPKEFK